MVPLEFIFVQLYLCCDVLYVCGGSLHSCCCMSLLAECRQAAIVDIPMADLCVVHGNMDHRCHVKRKFIFMLF